MYSHYCRNIQFWMKITPELQWDTEEVHIQNEVSRETYAIPMLFQQIQHQNLPTSSFCPQLAHACLQRCLCVCLQMTQDGHTAVYPFCSHTAGYPASRHTRPLLSTGRGRTGRRAYHKKITRLTSKPAQQH